MTQTYRIFGLSNVEPPPGPLLEHLRKGHPALTAHFKGDKQGWMRAELLLAPHAPAIVLERFLVGESEIRSQLNTWVAWLETVEHPRRMSLIDQVVDTQQLFTLQIPGELQTRPDSRELAQTICKHLAHLTNGVYQIDEFGFFSAEGLLLIPESKIV
jgi:hypothetical protein